MFGYVLCDKNELLVREYETYRGIYCGLCKNLRKTAGPFARLFLSYDMTFFALLGLSMLKRECKLHHGRCAFHPLKKRCFVIEEEVVDYASCASVLLGYYKLKDDVADEGFFGRLWANMCLWPFARMRKKILKNHPSLTEVDQVFEEQMKKLSQIEREESTLDGYCDPFGEMLATLFSQLSLEDTEKRVLREMGYFMGKWIYLMDATDDRAEDQQKGRFNALCKAFPAEEGEGEEPYLKRLSEAAEQYLYDTLLMLQKAFALLEIGGAKGILENILFRGMPARQKAVLSEKHK